MREVVVFEVVREVRNNHDEVDAQMLRNSMLIDRENEAVEVSGWGVGKWREYKTVRGSASKYLNCVGIFRKAPGWVGSCSSVGVVVRKGSNAESVWLTRRERRGSVLDRREGRRQSGVSAC